MLNDLKNQRLTSSICKPGDRVVCCLPHDGGYAEYVACDVAETLRLPQHISYAQGAAIYVAYFTAYRALVSKLVMRVYLLKFNIFI